MCEIYERVKHEMKSISDLNGKMYENEDVVFFRNHVQAAHYYAWGCELVDQFVDSNMKWVFVFKKSDHEWAKIKWSENKEKSNG